MSQKLAIIVVDPDTKYRKVVRQQVGELPSAELVGEADNPVGAAELFARTAVDVVLLDVASNPAASLEAATRWLREHPGLQVIASSASKSPELILSAMRAGAIEYLTKPLDAAEFRQAFERVAARVRANAPVIGHHSSVIAVFSKKGGQGVTTLAVNLAVALATGTEARTAIIDLAPDLGDVGALLDLTPEFTFADILDKNQRVDPGRLDICLARHASGLLYFGERESLDSPASLDTEHIKQMLEHLRSTCQYVVLDCPHAFDHVTQAALDGSDAVLLVATPEMPSIRATRYTLRVLRAAGYDHKRVRIILNRASRKSAISPRQVAETVEQPIAFEVPNDEARVIESINTGEPLLTAVRKSEIARSIAAIAETLRVRDAAAGGNGRDSFLRRVLGS